MFDKKHLRGGLIRQHTCINAVIRAGSFFGGDMVVRGR